MVGSISFEFLRRKNMTYLGSGGSPFGSMAVPIDFENRTDTADSLPHTRKAMTVLSQDEFDINTHFAPNKNTRKSTFFERLSDNEYWALMGTCLVAPAVLAAGATRVIRLYRTHKLKLHGIKSARNYLRIVSAFDPTHIPRLVPPPLPPNSDVDIRFPLTNNYPFLLNPGSLPNGITRENWRNSNKDDVIDAQNRVKTLTDEELRFFNIIFTNWAHTPMYNDTIYYYVEWVLMNKLDKDRAAQGYYPPTALKLANVPEEVKEAARKIYDVRIS